MNSIRGLELHMMRSWAFYIGHQKLPVVKYRWQWRLACSSYGGQDKCKYEVKVGKHAGKYQLWMSRKTCMASIKMDRNKWVYDVDWTGLGLCPLAGFSASSVGFQVWESWGIAPHIYSLSSRWKWVVSCLTPGEEAISSHGCDSHSCTWSVRKSPARNQTLVLQQFFSLVTILSFLAPSSEVI